MAFPFCKIMKMLKTYGRILNFRIETLLLHCYATEALWSKAACFLISCSARGTRGDNCSRSFHSCKIECMKCNCTVRKWYLETCTIQLYPLSRPWIRNHLKTQTIKGDDSEICMYRRYVCTYAQAILIYFFIYLFFQRSRIIHKVACKSRSVANAFLMPFSCYISR